MAGVIIAVVVAFIVVGVILARQTSARKKEATKSLEAEIEAVGQYNIADMVGEEVRDLGLRDIPGSQDIAAEVLLKVWTVSESTRSTCDKSDLRFEITSGIPPGEAGEDDVDLVCFPGESSETHAPADETADAAEADGRDDA